MTPAEFLEAELQKHPTLTRKEWYNQVYLKSDHWRGLRAAAIEVHGRKCEKCGTRRLLQVHHLRYRCIFNVEVSDLQILCEEHHKNEHFKCNKPKKMRAHRPRKIKVKRKPKKVKIPKPTRIDLVAEIGKWSNSFRHHRIPEASAIRHVMGTMGWLISKPDKAELRRRRRYLETSPPPDHPMVDEASALDDTFVNQPF